MLRRWAPLLLVVACKAREPVLEATPRALPLVPRPTSATTYAGDLELRASDRIAIDDEALRPAGELLARWLGMAGVDVTTSARTIMLRGPAGARDVRRDIPGSLDDEAYVLDVGHASATIHARSAAGFFYGAQTLAQLAGARRIGAEAKGPWHVPHVHLEDRPRFRYRAMHLDVARHFFGRDDVLRYVDLLAFYRFNVFHWHLTDDQGFRLPAASHREIASTPGNGPSYDEADIAAVIAYAAARGITVLPEIEMPGHSRAILAAHPELSCEGKPLPIPHEGGIFEDVLCAGNPGSLALVDDLLADVVRLFPSRWIHIGGDEVPPTRWTACPKCQAAAAAAHVPVLRLEGIFLQHAAATLARHGRRTMVWDEALGEHPEDAPSPDAIIVAWQSKERGLEAARRGHDVVMAPNQTLYFNQHQSKTGAEPGQEGHVPWTMVAQFDPHADAASAPRILGAEGAIWTEHIETRTEIETLAVPRMAVLAEVLWSGYAPDLPGRFARQRRALDGVNYFLDGPSGLADKRVFLTGSTARLELHPPALFPDATVRFTLDGSEPTAASPVFAPLTVTATTRIAAAAFLPEGRRSPTVRGSLVAETPRPAAKVAATAPGASFTYYEGHWRRLPDFATLAPVARGTSTIDLPSTVAALGTKLRPDHFGLVYEGLVRVPADGGYRFVATADDGVRVLVDGALVLDDDGNHAPRATGGEIALGAGLHPIRVEYFQGSEGKELKVELETANGLIPLEVVHAR